jgi:hypothetical protein
MRACSAYPGRPSNQFTEFGQSGTYFVYVLLVANVLPAVFKIARLSYISRVKALFLSFDFTVQTTAVVCQQPKSLSSRSRLEQRRTETGAVRVEVHS